MAISSPGIGSNLDVNTIVQNLMATEQGPLTIVNSQKAAYQSKISAYGTLKSSLASFQTALAGLASVSKFSAQSATSADTSVFTASANGKAVEGNYAVNVTQLAQPQKIAMAGVASTASALGTGTLTISFGTYDSGGNSFTLNPDKSAKTISIGASNNSLAGIRDAINAAGAGVMATIVNDGTTNRLVVTSKDSGTANSIKITVADDDATATDTSGLSQLAYDPTAAAGSGKNLTVLQAAKDALLTIDGVSVTKSSNVISDALDGLTLNLLKTSGGSSLNLGVARDSAAIETSVNAFVKAFNDTNSVLRSLTKYDPTTKVGGLLLGDSTARSISTQIKDVLTTAVSGSGSLTSLSQIGVGFQRDGTLSLDSSKLKTAIQDNFSDIASLFAAVGKATDAQVTQTGQSSKTQAGTYAINVTQLATQGNLLGSAAPNLTITSGSNDHLDLNIDSIAYSINLTAGTYSTAGDLAAELQTRISAAGSAAKVVVISGNIQVISANYGTDSSVTLTGGNGASDLFGSPTATTGVNTIGNINGVAATGQGQNLVGATGDASEGLVVKVAGTTLGSRGTVTYTKGYAYQLNELVTSLLGTNGILTSKTEGINSSITRLTKQQEALQARLVLVEKRYREQFTALDTLISSMQQTSTYMAQQIAQFQSNS
ncbi:MAG TPA: flagellar filament capping protein FliD [Methylophilaceae bacterium]|nr:flagellar filament capping protein FliD [Methylophilaceae bacterium]